ncbi:hypothetical protein M885DRAFT_584621 [Pelagophyceae sp. CCMP2097]|nr:hypothetical protein M885DRAFT_584621 [Pelagophyceae sp. CCMP2097]
MAMALAAGMVHSLISLAFAPNMVAALGASATFAPFSVQYIRIRAISACAFYLTMVGSSACFSERDSTSPFAIAVAAGFLNFLGNLFLCSRLPSALSSTAISTAAAQLAQCAATYALLARRGQLPDFRDLKRQRAAVPAPAVPAPASSWPSKVAEAVCDRTLLNRFFDVPTLQRLAPTFLAFSGGISITTSVHVFVYAFCGRSCCRIGGVTAAAAHHIASNLWWGISSLCAEPFDAALLAFLPEKLAASSQPSGPRWLDTAEARKTLRNHLVLSTLVGFALTAAVVRRVTGNSLRWLIDDAAVLAAVPVLPVALSCVLVGPMLVLEAAQVSLGCLRWLVAVMVASAIVACSGMVAVEQGRFAILPPSPDSYWLCVSLFVFLRFVGNGVGILRQCREAKPKPSRGRR